MIKEDQILLHFLNDKVNQRERSFMTTFTGFLDLRQQSLMRQWCISNHVQRWALYGGYEEAERKIGVFAPDYIPWEGENPWEEWLKQCPQDQPLAALRVAHSARKELSHRDYLGSLLHLGIRRDPIGDILVRDGGCDVIIDSSMGEFFIQNYLKVGNTPIKRKLISVNHLDTGQLRYEEGSDTVASLRLDSLVAAGFRTSRVKAAQAVFSGLVFVNGLAVEMPDAFISEGCKLVWRGRGKVLLQEVGNVTRKGRIFVRFRRYL